jgi:hypothetical protein
MQLSVAGVVTSRLPTASQLHNIIIKQTWHECLWAVISMHYQFPTLTSKNT